MCELCFYSPKRCYRHILWLDSRLEQTLNSNKTESKMFYRIVPKKDQVCSAKGQRRMSAEIFFLSIHPFLAAYLWSSCRSNRCRRETRTSPTQKHSPALPGGYVPRLKWVCKPLSEIWVCCEISSQWIMPGKNSTMKASHNRCPSSCFFSHDLHISWP